MNTPGKKKILITRTDKLGDVILTLPLVAETKRLFPDSEIHFLVKSYVKDLIENYTPIDKIALLDDLEENYSFKSFLKKEKYDIVINVYPRFNLAFNFFMAGIKTRIGTGYRWFSFLYNKKLYEHRKYAVKHESEYNIDLLKTVSAEVSYEKKFYFICRQDEKTALGNKIKFDLSEKYIIVHAGSKGSAKDWSAGNFQKYINLFIHEFENVKVLLTGIAEEENILNGIFDSVPDENKSRVIVLAGKVNLRELMILIDNSKLFISNSTGPIHIAGALNKNIIGFYPNQIPMNETRWKPLSENAVIMKPDNVSDDMDDIKPEKVISETKKFM